MMAPAPRKGPPMRPRPRPRRGMKLIEMMVVIFLVALSFGLSRLRWWTTGRGMVVEVSARTTCASLGWRCSTSRSSENCFPNAGTFYDDPSVHGGDPAKSSIYRSMLDPDSIRRRGRALALQLGRRDPALPRSARPGQRLGQDGPIRSGGSDDRGTAPERRLSKTGLGVLRCPDDPSYAARARAT